MTQIRKRDLHGRGLHGRDGAGRLHHATIFAPPWWDLLAWLGWLANRATKGTSIITVGTTPIRVRWIETPLDTFRALSVYRTKQAARDGHDHEAPPVGHFTCDDCPEAQTCRYAFDGYNTNGDCLAEK